MRNISPPAISKLHHCSHQPSPIVAHTCGIDANSITTRDYNSRSNTAPISKGTSSQKRVNSGNFTCCNPHNSRYLLVKPKLFPHSMSTINRELKSAKRQHWQPASISGRKVSQGSHVSSNESVILGFYVTETRHHRFV